MESKYGSLFMMWAKQHREMQGTVGEIQYNLAFLKELDITNFIKSLKPKIELLSGLFIDYSQREEKELFPILKQMYEPETELVQYVKKEHNFITKELQHLLTYLEEGLTEQGAFIHSAIFRVQDLLEEILVHLFEEENGLFPLVKGYLG